MSIYTVAIKGSQLIFACNFIKDQRIFMQFFTVRFKNERHTWRYKPNPPRLINVATLPCESQKHRKFNITAAVYQRKCHQMYHSFLKVDQGHHVPYIYLFGVLKPNSITLASS